MNQITNTNHPIKLMLNFGKPGRISHADGYVSLDENGNTTFYYYLKDHTSASLSAGLGNVRSVITPDANNNPVVTQANDYFPFGMSFESPIPHLSYKSTTNNKHKYNSKEEQEMPGKWLDYGARFYDAQIGRWHSIDPMIEKHYEWTGYAYVYNNPLRFIDPFGLDSADAAAITQAAINAVKYVKDNHGKTSAQCNRGVSHSHKETTGSDEFEGKTANEIVDHMENSSDFETVNRKDVQEQANDGAIIYGGKKEDSGSGHVNQAVPGKEVSSGNWGGSAPVGMDTGKNKRWSSKGMNYSWSSPKGVTFYKYTGTSKGTINNRTYNGGTLPEVTITAKGSPYLKPKPAAISVTK